MASRRIEDLNPDFQPMVKELLRLGSQAVSADNATFFITDGYRSMEEQQKIYNQGRTTPGSIVSWAKPGQSPHNYGLAVDMAFTIGGKLRYDKYLYDKVYPIARSLGFVLGADWGPIGKYDGPHFEYPNWQSKATSKPTPLPVQKEWPITPHTRNVTVTESRGLRMRTEPNTTSQTVMIKNSGESIAVVGYTEGQEVAGINLWWKTTEGYFVWSGATNIIPTPLIPKEQPKTTDQMQPAAQAPTVQSLLAEKKEWEKKLSGFVEQQKEFERAKKQWDTDREGYVQRLTELQKNPTNVEALTVTNNTLSNTIEALKIKNNTLDLQLKTARVQAFNGWTLVGVKAGPLGLAKYPVICAKLLMVMIQGFTQPYVLGWKVGGRIVKVPSETQSTEPVPVENYNPQSVG